MPPKDKTLSQACLHTVSPRRQAWKGPPAIRQGGRETPPPRTRAGPCLTHGAQWALVRCFPDSPWMEIPRSQLSEGPAQESRQNSGVGVGEQQPRDRAHRPTPTHLCLIHADETLVHLGPGRDSTDVPQLIGVLCKGARLHLEKRVHELARCHWEPGSRSPAAKSSKHHIHTCTHTRMHAHAQRHTLVPETEPLPACKTH